MQPHVNGRIQLIYSSGPSEEATWLKRALSHLSKKKLKTSVIALGDMFDISLFGASSVFGSLSEVTVVKLNLRIVE